MKKIREMLSVVIAMLALPFAALAFSWSMRWERRARAANAKMLQKTVAEIDRLRAALIEEVKRRQEAERALEDAKEYIREQTKTLHHAFENSSQRLDRIMSADAEIALLSRKLASEQEQRASDNERFTRQIAILESDVRLYSSIVERHQARIDAEAAEYASRQAAAEELGGISPGLNNQSLRHQ